MGAITKYLAPLRMRIALGLLIKLIGTIMDLFLPYILAHLIDDVVPTKNLKKIILLGVLMVVIAFVGWLGNIIANRMAAAVARKTTEAIRHDLYEKTLHLENREIDAHSIPSLQNRLTSDTYNIHQIVGMIQRLGVRAPILLVGGVFITLFMDPPLALVMLGMMPIIGFLIYKISRKGIPLYTKAQEAVDGMVRVARENIQGIRIIKALSKEEHEKTRFQRENTNVAQREAKAAGMMAVTNPLMSFLLNTGFVLVIIAGAYRVSLGRIEVGTIIAFQTYFIIILNAMLAVNRIFMMYSRGSASAKRVAEILDIADERAITPQPQSTTQSGDYLVFDRVSFSYNGVKNNLNEISFAVKKGGTLGIIGGTGSGKSTLIALMLGFYRDYTGGIYINGEEIRTLPLDTLRRRFGAVLQNDFIFTDTLVGNITLDRDISLEAVERAIVTAQASEFVDNLDGRLNYNVNAKGTNLSGGQRQRLLIARAMAGNPDILVLDDSCSALDYKTDALLRNAISTDISPQTTKIIIAQRISSVMSADVIIVLEDGYITDMGDHEHLMQSSSTYKQISDSQMGGVVA